MWILDTLNEIKKTMIGQFKNVDKKFSGKPKWGDFTTATIE